MVSSIEWESPRFTNHLLLLFWEIHSTVLRANTDHRHISSEGAEKSPQVIICLHGNIIFPSQKQIKREKSGCFHPSRVGTGQAHVQESPQEVWGSIVAWTWGCPQYPASNHTTCLLTAQLPFEEHWKQHLFRSSTFKWLRSLQRQLNHLMCLTGPTGRFLQSPWEAVAAKGRWEAGGCQMGGSLSLGSCLGTPALLPAVPPPTAAREQEVSPALSPCFCYGTYWFSCFAWNYHNLYREHWLHGYF